MRDVSDSSDRDEQSPQAQRDRGAARVASRAAGGGRGGRVGDGGHVGLAPGGLAAYPQRVGDSPHPGIDLGGDDGERFAELRCPGGVERRVEQVVGRAGDGRVVVQGLDDVVDRAEVDVRLAQERLDRRRIQAWRPERAVAIGRRVMLDGDPDRLAPRVSQQQRAGDADARLGPALVEITQVAVDQQRLDVAGDAVGRRAEEQQPVTGGAGGARRRVIPRRLPDPVEQRRRPAGRG